MQAILDQWKRLILPPETVPVRACEQLDGSSGLTEVSPGHLILKKHVAGITTYWIEPAWRDQASGAMLTKVGVLAIEEEADDISLTKAQALHAAATAAGLCAALEWPGARGCHLWLFSEPVALDVMTAALHRLAKTVPHTGRLVPVNRPQLKLAPGWHRPVGGWSYFHKPDERPTPVDTELLPEGLLDYQLEILTLLTPTRAAALAAFAGTERTMVPAPTAPTAAPAAEPSRFTLSDGPGGALRLRIAVAGGEIAVDLEPLAALDLAATLVDQARRRLAAGR